MSLVTYEEVRPWARAIRQRTSIRNQRGAMPPWYIEKNIGIQAYKDDPSLSDAEIATIARWVESGAPQGNPADLPPALNFDGKAAWTIGEPDLILTTQDVTLKGNASDWWGELANVATNLTTDRYVAALEVKEVNDVSQDGPARATVGGRFIFHHLIWNTAVPGEPPAAAEGGWPTHEVGRNAAFFADDAGKLIKAGSDLVLTSAHLHSNGRDTTARLLFGFKFHPEGYEPAVRHVKRALGNGVDIDIRPNEDGQRLDAYEVLERPVKITTFEPHMHAPGARMCLEAIWGINIQTLSCAGYDHNWVRTYAYEEDAQPLLPKGTILHLVGWFDNTPGNENVADPRNWSGAGNRSLANMFIDLGEQVELTDEQFREEMVERRRKRGLTRNSVVIGCPLCGHPSIIEAAESRHASEGGR